MSGAAATPAIKGATKESLGERAAVWGEWVWKQTRVATVQLGRYAWIAGTTGVVMLVPLIMEMEMDAQVAAYERQMGGAM